MGRPLKALGTVALDVVHGVAELLDSNGRRMSTMADAIFIDDRVQAMKVLHDVAAANHRAQRALDLLAVDRLREAQTVLDEE